MVTVAIANQKGGVAKTTSTYNLAAVKALDGKKVLMIDLDPQASLTIMCGMMPGKESLSVCDLFNLDTDPYDCGYKVEKSGFDNLYIIPSDILLAETEQNLNGRYEREKILKKQLSKFDGEFDYIFIDCPPQLGVLTQNALEAAGKVVIPTKAEYLSYRGGRHRDGLSQPCPRSVQPSGTGKEVPPHRGKYGKHRAAFAAIPA